MEDPGAMLGRFISPRPQRGPDERSRRSLHILESFTATRFKTPDSCTYAPVSWVASIKLAEVFSLIFISFDSLVVTFTDAAKEELQPVGRGRMAEDHARARRLAPLGPSQGPRLDLIGV